MKKTKIKRRWYRCQSPTTYSVSGCLKCKGINITWSEYKDHCWCYDCKIDYIPEHYGVFDGPIPINAATILGLCFDIIDIKTGKRCKSDTPEYERLIRK